MTQIFSHGRLRLYLLKLLEESPRHGYDVITVLENRFLGLYAPSAGTIYPRLARLEDEGLVMHDDRGGRKVYRLTAAGAAELERRRDELAGLEAEIASSVGHLAREVAEQSRQEARGSVRNLRAELQATAREVRREARTEARSTRGVAELARMLGKLQAEVVKTATRKPPDADALARCRAAVAAARAEILAALGA